MVEESSISAKSGARSISDNFIEHESFLKRFLKRFLARSCDIEDVVQDAYLKALSAERKQQDISSPKAFLFRIARNEALNEIRRRSRATIEYIDDLSQSETDMDENVVENEAIAKQRLGLFCQSALEMTPRCRRIFLMCKVYGASHKEIASQLGISVSGVEKQVAKGLSICSAYISKLEQPVEDEGKTVLLGLATQPEREFKSRSGSQEGSR